jgi:dTDP-4-amino-4,6-dideoxygalactose transaminase
MKTLHVGRPNTGDRARLHTYLDDILDRCWLTNDGPLVQEFEQRVAELTHTAHCIAVCNGTVALEIAARVAGLAGEVIVPSWTFIATAHALAWLGIKPVFADIDPVSWCIDPRAVEALITPRTTGILGVHLFGHFCNARCLREIADRHGLALLFDAAHTMGCDRDGIMGDIEVLSFHATKVCNSFEGGAIITDNEAIASKARLLRNFGFSGQDAVACLGTNGKMSEIHAAMGLVSLDRLEEFVTHNWHNYQSYSRQLDGLPGIELRDGASNYHYVVLDIAERRDELYRELQSEQILARRYFYPGCHRSRPYDMDGVRLPVTEDVAERILCLPTGMTIEEGDIGRICGIIHEWANSEAVNG